MGEKEKKLREEPERAYQEWLKRTGGADDRTFVQWRKGRLVAIVVAFLVVCAVVVAVASGAFSGGVTQGGGSSENENFVLPENIHSLQAFVRTSGMSPFGPISVKYLLLVKNVYDNATVKIARVVGYERVDVINAELGNDWYVGLPIPEENRSGVWYLDYENLPYENLLAEFEGGYRGWFDNLRYMELPKWCGENIVFMIDNKYTFKFWGIVLNLELNDNLFATPFDFEGLRHYAMMLEQELAS